MTSCSSIPSGASAATAVAPERVEELIVRYKLGAPPRTDSGKPWGSQCVSPAFVDRLALGRSIGAGMKVVHLVPPTSPFVARAIASQFEQCPYIEWAEADEIRLTLS